MDYQPQNCMGKPSSMTKREDRDNRTQEEVIIAGIKYLF